MESSLATAVALSCHIAHAHQQASFLPLPSPSTLHIYCHIQLRPNSSYAQDPEEFAECIRKEMSPVNGRPIHVELLPATLGFRPWLFDASIHITGLASTHAEPHACHVWRFEHREALEATEIVHCQNELWAGLTPQVCISISAAPVISVTPVTPPSIILLEGVCPLPAHVVPWGWGPCHSLISDRSFFSSCVFPNRRMTWS